ncbi:hypothetical protein [Flavobacterium sp. PL02]|uniref:hypothetical protein n=1 Tax=Flavobacterium sp. PL02 TaxID=3088354 RepID=UPI002B2381C4|nr:hypothetical protein [Flavobacterium sp. PL02]MEA9413547.1 hypothetical protein [Flavobacterium sp. PL02]
MKKLELNQMEILLGGQIKPKRYDDDSGGGSSLSCTDALGLGAIVLGATGFSPLGWVGFAGLMLMCD